eukprot:10943785-Ditylum_brightwellii.AAC.1
MGIGSGRAGESKHQKRVLGVKSIAMGGKGPFDFAAAKVQKVMGHWVSGCNMSLTENMAKLRAQN